MRTRTLGLAFLATFALPGPALADSGSAAPSQPLTVTLEGPAVVPFTVQVNTAEGFLAGSTVAVDVYQDGKGLKRLKLAAGRAATTKIAVPEGEHVYVFRAEDPSTETALISWTAPAVAATVAPVAAPRLESPVGAGAATGRLSASYTPVTGEMVAIDLAQILEVIEPVSGADTMIHYDKSTKKLVVSIVGTEGNESNAKRAVETFRANAFDPLQYRAELQFQVKVRQQDITIRYLNRADNYMEVVRYDGGTYVATE